MLIDSCKGGPGVDLLGVLGRLSHHTDDTSLMKGSLGRAELAVSGEQLQDVLVWLSL